MITRKIRKIRESWFRYLMPAFGVVAVGLLFSSTGWAQLKNYLTVADFSTSFEVPGSDPQVLPAGTYTFKVVDAKADREIVQISNKDDTHVFATVLAIPAYRQEETDRTVITFDERGVGQPQAIRAWFYPHEKKGYEFVGGVTRGSK